VVLAEEHGEGPVAEVAGLGGLVGDPGGLACRDYEGYLFVWGLGLAQV